MKNAILHIFLFKCLFSFGQNSSLTDGPHLFYGDRYLFVESVINGSLKKDSFLLQSRNGLSLQVAVPGKPNRFFTVPLKKKLESEKAEYKTDADLFVVSDVEGTFTGFDSLLRTGGVIDENYNWNFGNGHLVICGDLFDRGEEVTACLWLLYKLEEEAKAKGGYVHVILGNHEIMNLSEDIRYVHPKYLESATLMGKTYMDFYSAHTELGRWLRTKNIIERVNEFLFLHGGVSQAVNENDFSLRQINSSVRPFYDKDGYNDLLIGAKVWPFFNPASSPYWYRGYFVAPKASMAQVDSTLSKFDVKHIVVGHTIVDSIQALYDGKIIAIDVNHHIANHQALFIQKNEFFRINAKGEKTKLN